MLLKREYLLDYMERNRRTLSLAIRDIDLFKQLLTHVDKVKDSNPQSRYYKVFNEHLVSNPDVATKVQIALERMVEELKERRATEAKEAVRKERKEQAMAVVEAAYNKIYHGMHGDLALTKRKENDEEKVPKQVITINSDGEEVVEVPRVDPITRFKDGLAQPSNYDLMQIGDLAERDPFYLLKDRKKVQEDPVMKFFTTDPDNN